jgi:hypothetical protein
VSPVQPRPQSVFSRNFGLRLVPHRLDERVQLGPQRLDVVDLQLLDVHELREIDLRQIIDLASADARDRVADRS